MGVSCGAVSSFIFDSQEKMRKVNNMKAFLKMREKKRKEESVKNNEIDEEDKINSQREFDDTNIKDRFQKICL